MLTDWKQLIFQISDAIYAEQFSGEEEEAADPLARLNANMWFDTELAPSPKDITAYQFRATVRQGRVVCDFRPQNPEELLVLVADNRHIAVFDAKPGDSFPLPTEPNTKDTFFGRRKEIPHNVSLVRVLPWSRYAEAATFDEVMEMAREGYDASGTIVGALVCLGVEYIK